MVSALPAHLNPHQLIRKKDSNLLSYSSMQPVFVIGAQSDKEGTGFRHDTTGKRIWKVSTGMVGKLSVVY